MPMQSHAQFVCVITLITCVLVVIVTTDGIWMHEWSLVHAKPRRIPHQGNRTCKLNVYLAHPALQSAACSAGAGAATAGGRAEPAPGLRDRLHSRPGWPFQAFWQIPRRDGRRLQGVRKAPPPGCVSRLGNAAGSRQQAGAGPVLSFVPSLVLMGHHPICPFPHDKSTFRRLFQGSFLCRARRMAAERHDSAKAQPWLALGSAAVPGVVRKASERWGLPHVVPPHQSVPAPPR